MRVGDAFGGSLLAADDCSCCWVKLESIGMDIVPVSLLGVTIVSVALDAMVSSVPLLFELGELGFIVMEIVPVSLADVVEVVASFDFDSASATISSSIVQVRAHHFSPSLQSATLLHEVLEEQER